MARIIDQFGRKRCKKKRKDVGYKLLCNFFLNILWYMYGRLLNICSLHRYVMHQMFYFERYCNTQMTSKIQSRCLRFCGILEHEWANSTFFFSRFSFTTQHWICTRYPLHWNTGVHTVILNVIVHKLHQKYRKSQ